MAWLAELLSGLTAVGAMLAMRWLFDLGTPRSDWQWLRRHLPDWLFRRPSFGFLRARAWLDVQPILRQRKLDSLRQAVQSGTLAGDTGAE